MFSVSVKGKYGLMAVLELAGHMQSGPVQIKTIAEQHGIPQNYLEQVLVDLKRGGIVKSFRGQQGGYVLAESPEEISVLEVLACLEGPIQLVAGMSGGLDFFWMGVEVAIKDSLQISLADLMAQKNRAERTLMYSI